jgi:aryl-alcohol dehydrogenase-like predicted oxidoreductase
MNPAEVALRFALDYPGPDSTLIGVSDEAQLASSLSVLELELPEGLMADIDAAIGSALNMRWHDGLPENYE